METDEFGDIRPYTDAEVSGVLARLLAAPEFIDAITALRFGWPGRLLRWPLRRLVRRVLAGELAGVEDVHSFQLVVEKYMSAMIRGSTAGFTVSGLDNLMQGWPSLFVSNHRDITLDPAFTNYALYHNGHTTVRIAIGDNLLTKPYVSDLMRLNKSFIVKRSAKGPRQILEAYRHLSAYIRHSVCEERAPVWIAQREGRAKDGIDRTEPAIIKMLAMSRDKRAGSFGDHIASLNVVPVSISYELDPCDARKAAELHAVAQTGSYEKAEHEDVASIAIGIAGQKGHVHVAFGKPLGAGLDTPEAVAQALDAEIIRRYALFGTNIHAYRLLHGTDATIADETIAGETIAAETIAGSCSEAEFERRIQAMPKPHREHALGIYANAVVSKLGLAPGGAHAE